LRLIFGIGNPGNSYKHNRHNVGFIVLDHFASLHSLSFLPSKGDYFYSEGSLEGQDYQLIKPTTYVNNSGIAARQAIDRERSEIKDLLAIYDDVNLLCSEVKVKVKGGDGGHNGISSLIYHLGSEDFARIRIGIGNDFEKGEMADYVLTNFSTTEFEKLEGTFKTVDLLIKGFIIGGIQGLLDTNSRISNLDNKGNENNNTRI
jgi:PTH1 family peptidyl-tRNA hydrolase